MAEETASNLTGKRVSTTFRGLLHFPKSIEPSLAKQVVHDGMGTPTALTLGGDTMGMDVSGDVSTTGSISAKSNFSVDGIATIGGNVTLTNGGNINDVSILSSGSSVSLRSPSAAEVGKLRIRETSSDYELLFGNPTVTDKNLFSVIVKNDSSNNLYIKNSYSDVDVNAPLWINRSTGEVNIRSLRVNNIKTDPPPGTTPPPGQQTNYGDPNRNVLPVGMICMFPALGIPNGWIKCDGAQHDKRTLPELFAVIQYNYSVLKTGNLFQVPDYRGLFVRGLDYKQTPGENRTFIDPDEERNLDGTVQEDEVRSHSHNLDRVLTWPSRTGYPASAEQEQDGNPNDYSAYMPSTSSFGGPETRPKNVVALYCIKW